MQSAGTTQHREGTLLPFKSRERADQIRSRMDLARAVALYDEDAALECLAAAPEAVHTVEQMTGYMPLHSAAEFGMLQLLQALIQAGAPLEAQTRDLVLQKTVVQPAGCTPLYLAARAGEADLVKALLEAGADPTHANIDGVRPAVAAAMQQHDQLSRLLIDNYSAAAAPLGVEDQLLLQSAEQRAALKARAQENGAARVAESFAVPESLRVAHVLEAVWTPAQCVRVLSATRNVDEWTTQRHGRFPTNDLPLTKLGEPLNSSVRQLLRRTVLAPMARMHNWLPKGDSQPAATSQEEVDYADSMRLSFRDLFVIRYSCALGLQPGLQLHRDGSLVSFNILLNEASEFDGGGTILEQEGRTVLIQQGDCLVHSGKVRHGAAQVTRGERFVLVAFVDVQDE